MEKYALVAHVRQEVRLQLRTLLVGSDEAQLGRLPLRQIAGDLAEADVGAVLVDVGDDHVGPEAAPVLAVAPALVLDAAVLEADLELLGRLLVSEVVFPVEDGEVLADDLLFLVAFVE